MPNPKPVADVLLRDIVLSAILAAINRTGNQTRAAKELGISRPTVIRYICEGFSDGRPFQIIKKSRLKYKVKRGESE
jgi:predicted transcriptional regulator